MEVDYLIAGQGLAGTALGWRLRERGARVLIVDREEEMTSSRVAAGIMTPITGLRLVKTWRIDELWPCAKTYYRGLEALLGTSFFHEMPIARLFRSEAEAALWKEKFRAGGDAFRDFVDEGAGDGIEGVRAPFGGLVMRNCGYVDVRRYLDASRAFFKSAGMYRRGALEDGAFDPAGEAIEWEGVRVTGAVISCTGHAARLSRFFDWVPFKAAKGEILTVEMRGVREDRILNRGNWLLPLGDGLFRTGTTYAWKRLDTVPTSAARREIEARLAELVDADSRVTAHEAAVRPIIRESKVVMGRHPAYSRLGFFNGLGSKGVLIAPYFAAQFAAHLAEGGPIERALDLRRNF